MSTAGGRSGSGGAADPAKLFASANSMYKRFNEQLGSTLASVCTLSEVVLNSETYEGDKKLDLKKMLVCAEKLARIEAESQTRGEICWAIRDAINREVRQHTEPVNETEEYERRLNAAQRRWKGADASAVKNSLSVKGMNDLLERAENGDDDILVECTTNAPRRCPIMASDLIDPLVNTECGHVYSTEGTIGYLCQGQTNRAIPKTITDVDPMLSKNCPVAGCTKIVRSSNMKRDFRSENSQRQAAKRAQTQGAEGEAEDEMEVLD